MAPTLSRPKEFKQKFFAGEGVFVYLAVAFGIALALQLSFGQLDWFDAALFALYLAVLAGFFAGSAFYPDVRVAPGGFAYRVFFRYRTLPWEAVRRVSAHPKDVPTGILITVADGRRRRLLIRRKAVDGFEELVAELARYVPADRWFGFGSEGAEEDER